MIHLVPRAFRTTRVANFRAQLADAFREVGTSGHFPSRKRTDIRAAAVEFDATRHHFDVFFVQTRSGAVFAGLHALVTGLNAVFVMFVGHDLVLLYF